jgi:hypothetical protein
MIDPLCSLHENPHLTMTSQRAPPRSNAEKLSDCIKYITGGGGFHSFGQFLSTLLDDVPNQDQVVIQTVSHFFEESHLRSFLDKLAEHRLLRGRYNLQSAVPWYGFRPSDPQQEGTSAMLDDIFLFHSHSLRCRGQ